MFTRVRGRRLVRSFSVALLVGATLAAPARAVTRFAQEFSGPAGSVPSARAWRSFDGDTSPYLAASPVRTDNAFLNGTGQLVLRVQREPDGYTGPFSKAAAYSSSFIGTFDYGSGWPPTIVRRDWRVPLTIEMRAQMPDAPGLWAGLWPISTDRNNTTEGVYEIDAAEERTTLASEAGCHEHLFRGGHDVRPWDGAVRPVTLSDWHVYRVDIHHSRVDYWVDGRRCGNGPAPGVTGRFGILLDNKVAPPGSWAAAGGAIPPDDPGPWDFVIDYLRVRSG
jgi:hypothetical protein